MKLFEHITNKNPGGIPFEEAKQLFLWLYCTLGILPEPIRHDKIGKKELTETFSSLAAQGKLLGLPRIVAQANVAPFNDPSDQAYWERLVNELLHNEITLDSSFESRCSQFV